MINWSVSNWQCRPQKPSLRSCSLKIPGSTTRGNSLELSATSISSKRSTSASLNRMSSSYSRIMRSSRRESIETSMPCLTRSKRSTKNYRRRRSWLRITSRSLRILSASWTTLKIKRSRRHGKRSTNSTLRYSLLFFPTLEQSFSLLIPMISVKDLNWKYHSVELGRTLCPSFQEVNAPFSHSVWFWHFWNTILLLCISWMRLTLR